MLRPASAEALEALLAAAAGDDSHLDTALTRLGVLPPVDLIPIRTWLSLQAVVLKAAANPDGHRIIEIVLDGAVAARIHHDGRVDASGEPMQPLAALTTA